MDKNKKVKQRGSKLVQEVSDSSSESEEEVFEKLKPKVSTGTCEETQTSLSVVPVKDDDVSRESGSTIPVPRRRESDIDSSDDEFEPPDDQKQPDERTFFHCSHCSKRFAAFSSLQGHISIWHNEAKDQKDKDDLEKQDPVQTNTYGVTSGDGGLLEQNGPETSSNPANSQPNPSITSKKKSKKKASKFSSRKKASKFSSGKKVKNIPCPCSCSQCGKTFNWPANLKRHIEHVHQVREPENNLEAAEQSNHHEKANAPLAEGRTSTPLIEENFSSFEGQGSAHPAGQSGEHNNEKTCKYCLKTFSSRTNRNRHQKSGRCTEKKTENKSTESSSLHPTKTVAAQNANALESRETGPGSSKSSVAGSDFSSATTSRVNNRRDSVSNKTPQSRQTGPSGSPHISKRRIAAPHPRMPVQLTWKGVQIYFPVVTLTEDLKIKADEALKLKRLRESDQSFSNSLVNEAGGAESADGEPSAPMLNINEHLQPLNNTEASSGKHLKQNPKQNLNLNDRKPSHTSNPERTKNSICRICERDCKNPYTLKRHLKLHSASNARKYPCEKCGVRCRSFSHLQRHIEKCTVVIGEAASTSKHSTETETSNNVRPEDHSPEQVDFCYGVKVERPDCSEENFRNNDCTEEDGSHQGILNRTEGHQSDSGEEEFVQPKVTQAWGNVFLQKLEERQQSNQHSKLDSQTLKAKIREKALTNMEAKSSNNESFENVFENSETQGVSSKNKGLKSLECRFCGMIFSVANKLNLHASICERMVQPTDSFGRLRKFYCKFCPWKFMTHKVFRSHLIKVHSETRLEDCTTSKTSLDITGSSSQPSLKISSSPSQPPLKTPPALIDTASSSSDKPFSCNTCGRHFMRRCNLNQHSVIHKNTHYSKALLNKRRFSCHVCGKRFRWNSELVRHARTHQGEVSKMSNSTSAMVSVGSIQPFKCGSCGKSFGRRINLIQHSVVHNRSYAATSYANSQLNKKFTCHICKQKFRVNSELLEHIKTHENAETAVADQKPFKCDVCGKQFSKSQYLTQHSVAHIPSPSISHIPSSSIVHIPSPSIAYIPSTQKMECHICYLQFSTNFNLRRHIINKHGHNNLPIAGTSSGKSSTNPRKGSKNEKDVRDVEDDSQAPVLPATTLASQSFKCGCGQNFSNKLDLSQHCMTHVMGELSGVENYHLPSTSSQVQPITAPAVSNAGGLIYTCKYKNCQHSFSHDEDLWYHIDKKHKSMDNLCCPECGQDCESEHTLRKHCTEIHQKSFDKNENEEVISSTSVMVEKSPVVVKVEASEFEHETIFDDEGEHHFPEPDNHYETEDDKVPETEHQSQEDYDEPDPSFLIPQTQLLDLTEIDNPHNPVVVISAEIKAAADEALNKYYEQQQEWPVFSSIFGDLSQEERKQGKFRADIPYQDEYKCTKCEGTRVFDNRQAYIAHINYHEKNPLYGNQLSGSRLRKSSIPMQDVYTCDTCPNKTFTNRYLFIAHRNYHKKRKEIGLDGPTRKLRREDIPVQDEYTCEKCDSRTFPSRHSYILHLRYHEIMRKSGKEHMIGKGRQQKPENNIPFQDVYNCERCPEKRDFTRKQYISHLNYHKIMRKIGKEDTIGTVRPGRVRDDIPFQDIYTCERCPDEKTFTNRTAYINHVNYHKIMRKIGKEDTIGTGRPGRPARVRDDIPFQDIYTCERCPDEKTFTNRTAYISHLNYHKIMRKIGKEDTIGTGRPGRVRDDIPFQDIYTCERCPDEKTFTNRTAYINHVNYHTIMRKKGREHTIGRGLGFRRLDIPHQDVYTCEICEDRKTFTERKLYIGHLNYHEQSRKKILRGSNRRRREGKSDYSHVPYQDFYTCDTCHDRTFTSRISYINHVKYHDLLKKQGHHRPIGTKSEMRRSDVPLQDSYTCETCEEHVTFTDRGKYLRHLYYHEVLAKKQTESTKKRKPLQRLIPIQSVYRCNICTEIRTYTDRKKYIDHLAYHRMKSKAISDMASGLVNSTESEQERETRLLNKIPDQDNYTCEKCDQEKIFASKIDYVRHMYNHKVLKNMAYQCLLCEKGFVSGWSLSQHMKSHTGTKDCIECGDCGKSYATKSTLQRHQEKFCKKVQCKYTCHCGAKFHIISHLESHTKRVHEENSTTDTNPDGVAKVFRCYVCNEEFDQSTSLSQHVMQFHPADYLEFMQQKEATIAAAVALGHQLVEPYQNESESQEDDHPCDYMIPEVVFKEENNDNVVNEGDDTNAAELPSEETSWNFIPGLEGNDDEDSDSDEYYDDFIPESFEPEDIEVEGSDQTQEASSTVNIVNKRKQNMTPDLASEPTSVNTDTTPKPKRRRKVDTTSGRYECFYCNKRALELKHLKIHFTVSHKGLELKYRHRDSSSPSKTVSSSSVANGPSITIKKVQSNSYSSSQSEQSNLVPTDTIVELRQRLDAAGEVSASTSSETSKNRQQTGNRIRIKVGGPKSKLRCGCEFSDTALGYLKRCTGEGCKCYVNTKGCSDNCNCKGSCSNPYFRGANSSRPIPNLVPVKPVPISALQIIQSGTARYTAVTNVLNSAQVVSPTFTTAASLDSSDVSSSTHLGQPYQYNLQIMDSTPVSSVIPSASTSGSTPDLVTRHISSGRANNAISQLDQEFSCMINESPSSIASSHQQSTLSMNRYDDNDDDVVILNRTEAQLDQLLLQQKSQNSGSNSTPPRHIQEKFAAAVEKASSEKTITMSMTNLISKCLNKPNEYQKNHIASSNNGEGIGSGRLFVPTSASSETQRPPDSSSRGYKCLHCDKAFLTLQVYVGHQKVHKDKSTFQCPVCPEKFSMLNPINRLSVHVQQHHAETSAFLCQVCQVGFNTNELLNWHIEVYHPDVQCKYCKLVFDSSKSLTEHMRSVHYLCDTCGATFNLLFYYQQHLEKVHDVRGTEIRKSSLPSESLPNLASTSRTNQNPTKRIQQITYVDLDEDVIIEESRPSSPLAPVIVASTSLAPRET